MKTFADNKDILSWFTVNGIVPRRSLATISHYYTTTAEFNY